MECPRVSTWIEAWECCDKEVRPPRKTVRVWVEAWELVQPQNRPCQILPSKRKVRCSTKTCPTCSTKECNWASPRSARMRIPCRAFRRMPLWKGGSKRCHHSVV